METGQNLLERVLNHPYGPYAILIVIAIIVLGALWSAGYAKFLTVVKAGARQEILDAKAKGYKVTDIVDTVTQKVIAKVKDTKSKLMHVAIALLTNKYILNIVKKRITKIVNAISEEAAEEKKA